MFVLLVVVVLFSIVYASLFSYIWIPEWERAADTRFIICLVCLLKSLHVVTSFPWYIVGRVWDQIVSLP